MAKKGFASRRPAAALAAMLLVAVAAFPAECSAHRAANSQGRNKAAHSIGVCNGVIGNNLPSPADVVKLYRSKGIGAMRIYAPESNVLRALRGTGIALLMDVANEELAGLASSPTVAAVWVKANVQPYPGVSFRYIAVGNEVMDSDGQKNILPAMKNLDRALAAAGLGGIKVSTAVRFDVIADTYPPSSGVFADDDFMDPIAEYLESTGAPLLVNVYPYFAYVGDTTDIHLTTGKFIFAGWSGLCRVQKHGTLGKEALCRVQVKNTRQSDARSAKSLFAECPLISHSAKTILSANS